MSPYSIFSLLFKLYKCLQQIFYRYQKSIAITEYALLAPNMKLHNAQ